MTRAVDEEIRVRHDAAIAAGEPAYVDPATGYQVFTAQYLLDRGHCCDSRCRHCPYRTPDTTTPETP